MILEKVIGWLRRTQHEKSGNLRVSVGVLLILIGVAGLFLPFIQGLLLISIGFIIVTRKDWKRLLVKKWDKYREWSKKKKENWKQKRAARIAKRSSRKLPVKNAKKRRAKTAV